MVRIGNFLFHYRNALFPIAYLLLFVKSRPVVPDYWAMAGLGLLVATLGQLLRAVSIGLEYIIRGGKDRRVYAEKLVQGGMFAHCRNPLYVGNFLILLGVGLASNSVLFLAVAIPFFIFAYWAIIAAEENFLRNKFGQEFDAYCSQVNRILPNFAGFGQTVTGMRFNWRRLVTAEYGSTFIWMMGIILVTIKNIWVNGDHQSAGNIERALWVAVGLVTVGYLAARFMKKRGLLEDTPSSVQGG